jgi:CheY-like chemotaxis protein
MHVSEEEKCTVPICGLSAGPVTLYILRVHSPSGPVLLVEDCEDDAVILTHMLERSGATRPTVYATAEAAVQNFQQAAPEIPLCAFIDVTLPGMSGFDLLRWIRSQEALRQMAVALFSASDEPRNLGKAAQLGADCYLIKFPTMSILRDVVTELRWTVDRPLPRPPVPIPCNLLAAGPWK